MASTCSLRRLHVPAAPAPDSHHIVPQAWQHFVTGSLRLFDPETVEVCPNCHRRVHEAIVAMMRAGAGNDPLASKLAAYGAARLNREQTVAYAALTRFAAHGAKLEALRAAGLWGEQ